VAASAPPRPAHPPARRLDGSKLWIHNAPVADFAVVLARTDATAGKRGMSIFVVDLDRPGVRAGAKEHKMGQRASPVGALFFDRVELPGDALLGPENRGFHLMMSVLDKGRVGIGALAVGILQAALDASIVHANARHQFGHAIAEFQAIQWLIADMAKSLHAARLLVRDAAQTLDRGERATLAASIAKCFATDAAVEHTSTPCRSTAAWVTCGASRWSGSTATPRSRRSRGDQPDPAVDHRPARAGRDVTRER
jgi:alkylation response protein AidB-like acyl-CoA dehydrogenase